MANVINKSERLIMIEGYWLTPLTPMDVPDTVLNNDRIKELFKSGELETVSEKKAETVSPAPAPMPDPEPKPKITKSSIAQQHKE